MRNRIRAYEADQRLIEVIEHTYEDEPFLYTVIFDEPDSVSPRIQSFGVEREESPDRAKKEALELFNKGVLEFVTLEVQ